jgi:hypothetical protein
LECVLKGGIDLFQVEVEIEADSEKKNAMKGKGEDSW